MIRLLPTCLGASILLSRQMSISAEESNESNLKSAVRRSICLLRPTLNSKVSGMVSFEQNGFSEPTKVVASVNRANPNSKMGMFVHQYGDLLSNGKFLGPRMCMVLFGLGDSFCLILICWWVMIGM